MEPNNAKLLLEAELKQKELDTKARLLYAASPLLLSACKAILGIWGHIEGCSDKTCSVCQENDRVKELINNAIAEAEGKKQESEVINDTHSETDQ